MLKEVKISREDQWNGEYYSVPSNIQSLGQEALLYVFENNEALIKMII